MEDKFDNFIPIECNAEQWMMEYIDMFTKLTKEERESLEKLQEVLNLHGSLVPTIDVTRNRKLVYCPETNRFYDGVCKAAEELGMSQSAVVLVLKGYRDNCKGYHFEYA